MTRFIECRLVEGRDAVIAADAVSAAVEMEGDRTLIHVRGMQGTGAMTIGMPFAEFVRRWKGEDDLTGVTVLRGLTGEVVLRTEIDPVAVAAALRDHGHSPGTDFVVDVSGKGPRVRCRPDRADNIALWVEQRGWSPKNR